MNEKFYRALSRTISQQVKQNKTKMLHIIYDFDKVSDVTKGQITYNVHRALKQLSILALTCFLKFDLHQRVSPTAVYTSLKWN